MTLNTSILIHQYTDIHALREWINTNLLGAPDALPWETGPHTAHNKGGQGRMTVEVYDMNKGRTVPA